MRYVGVYRPGETYRRGEMLTFKGSVWHVNVDETQKVPGEDPVHFTLAVKSGRDGRDGERGKPGEDGRDLRR